MGKYSGRLAKADQQWKDAESGFPEIPEGQYVAQVSEAKVRETNAGNLCAVVGVVIAGGECHGQQGSVWYTLESENENAVRVGMAMLKETFENLGREVPERLADVEDALEALSKDNPLVTLEAKKGKQGDRVFLKITGLADAADAEAAAPSTEAEAPAEEAAEAPAEGGLAVGVRVQFENDGTTYTGTIESVMEDGTYKVAMEDGSEPWEGVPADVLQLVEGEAPAAEQDPEVADLFALAQTHGLAVDDGMGKAELVKALKGKRWVAAELTDDEKALLKKNGITMTAPAAPARKPAAPAPAPARKPVAPAPKAPAKPAAPARKPAPAPAKKPAPAPARKPAGKK